MARTGLVLARYVFASKAGALSRAEQAGALATLKEAPPIHYRVKDPQPDDRNTYIIAPTAGTRKGEEYLSWQVCRDINQRPVRRVDRDTQTVAFDFEHTDDCQLARIVALPRLGVLAVEDSTGEGHLGGWSALGRFSAIVAAYLTDASFEANPAGSPQDLRRAIETWDLDKFAFQARPFNPHPSNPGEALSDLLEKDGIGDLRAIALPKPGAHIHPKDSGLVKEAMGLADKGYATYGATGRTPSGAEAIVKKQAFSYDRQTNMSRLAGPQQLRVYVTAEKDEDRVKQIVDVLIEFFETDAQAPL